MHRSWSVPPGNPFWSSRAQMEWELSQLRPHGLPVEEEVNTVNLPVPGHAEFGGPGQDDDELRAGHRRALMDWSEKFRTPRSWNSEHKGKGAKGAAGIRSQGPLPQTPRKGKSKGASRPEEEGGQGVDLEREVEKVMMEQLMEANQRLQEQVRILQLEKERVEGSQAETSDGPWTVITPPPPPPPRSPSRRERRSRTPKYTPQGTQVPESPWGDHREMPPWPMSIPQARGE